jgi:hypothetical protein
VAFETSDWHVQNCWQAGSASCLGRLHGVLLEGMQQQGVHGS